MFKSVKPLFALTALALSLGFANAYADNLPHVVVMATGGTIAGTGSSSTVTVGYQAAKLGVDQMIEAVPELQKVAHVTGEQVAQIASESMTDEVWLKLAKEVNRVLAQPDVDGVVITHGSDTLEETAYFLDLVVKSKKPVVLVASMRPSTAISADGPINLYNGVILAGSKEAVGKGVLVCLNDQIDGARDVTKSNTSKVDTFRSPDLGALGYMQDNKAHFYHVSTHKNTVDTPFDVSNLTSLPRVDIVYGYEGMDDVQMKAGIAAGAQGVVVASVGDGSVPKQMYPEYRQARQDGVIVVRSSRVGSGIVARNGEANDDQEDLVVSDTLNPQKARILLRLALTKTHNTQEIQKMFYTY